MSDRNKTFHAVKALLSLQDQRDKLYNLTDLQFSDQNRNISVGLGFDDIRNLNREISISNQRCAKPRVYLEMAKIAMRNGNIELRDSEGFES